MPLITIPDLSGFVPAFQLFVACTGAYLVALWLSLIILGPFVIFRAAPAM